MRIWTLTELFDGMRKIHPNENIIHVCDICERRTPAHAQISINSPPLVDATLPIPKTIEVRENSCDECNRKEWDKLQEDIEFEKNNCKYCGGRCEHYPNE